MKEVLLAFAEYNRDANKKLIGIMRDVDEAILREDQGSYYKSILGTLEHIAGGELGFLRRFAGFTVCKCLASHRFITGDIDALKNAMKDKPETIYATLEEADALLVAFANEVSADELTKRVSYLNYKGEKLERDYWNLVVHIINHSTHHRGEISVLLDRKKIANDVAGFNSYRS
ncbi:MAG: DinB family protein [Treponemataceae bacterium]